MNSFYLETVLSIYSNAWKSIPSKRFPSVGIASDFEVWIFVALGLAGVCFCAINFLFLRKHEICRRQMETNRRFQLIRDYRLVATYQFTPWQRTIGNLACKVGFMLAAYSLASCIRKEAVCAALIATLVYIFINIRLVLRAVLHGRSLFYRRFLFHRADPTFVRTRLLFELVRRFMYFVVGFALISYSIHRLTGNGVVFGINVPTVSLFLSHLQSSVSGMTSLGNDPVSYMNNFGMCFQFIRSTFAFLLILTFASLAIASIFNPEDPLNRTTNAAEMLLPSQPQATALSKSDINALIELVLERRLEVAPDRIRPESDLTDLGADSLDRLEICLAIENELECQAINFGDLVAQRTVQDLCNFCFEKYRDRAESPNLRHQVP